jgi:hypothetical protein
LQSLALLWLTQDSQITFSVTHGWSAFRGADHDWQDVGLERRAWRFSQAVSGSKEHSGDGQAALSWKKSGSAGASGCSGRISNGTDESGDGSGRDRSCHRGQSALWLRAGGCRFWAQRAVPPGAHGRKRTWAVGIPRHLKVYPADVRMIWPVVKRRRPRQRAEALKVIPASVRGPCPVTILSLVTPELPLTAYFASQRKLLRQCAKSGEKHVPQNSCRIG